MQMRINISRIQFKLINLVPQSVCPDQQTAEIRKKIFAFFFGDF